MYLLEIDRAHNRMHMTLAEAVDVDQTQALLDELRLRFGELQRGFHVLCDLSRLEQFDLPALKLFRRVMDLCNDGGVSRVVRIIPDPLENFGLTLMSVFHYDNGVKIVNCRDLNEALGHLR